MTPDRKSKLRRAGIALLVVTVLLCGAWTIMNVRASARIAEAVAAGRAAGLPGSMTDVRDFLDGRFGPVSSTENAAPLYEAAAARVADLTFPQREEDGLQIVDDALRSLVERAAPAYTLLEQATALPRCRYGTQWEDGIAARMPEIPASMSLRRALECRAAVRLADGDVRGAVLDARLLAALGASFEEQPTLIGQMIRIAHVGAADTLLRDALPGHPQPLEAWQETAEWELRGAVVYGLHGEFAFAATAVATVSGDGVLDGALLHDLGLLWPLHRGSMADVLDSYRELVARSGDAYPALLEYAAARDEAAQDGGPLVAMMSVTLRTVIDREARTVTERAVTEAGARLLQFRREHDGRTPSSLAEIPGVPTDPRTGEPLVLTVDGERVTIAAADGTGEWEVAAPR